MSFEWKQFAKNTSLVALLLFVPLLAGCGCLRLPAIDPSGDHIFLPAPNYTKLETCLPKPAYPTPPDAPKCVQTSLATAPIGPIIETPQQTVLPVSLTGPLPPGRNMLKLTPARVVAPVGSEVVLTAGYCGTDGYFITKQPIEWTLTQDSVGHFVEVGQHPDCYLPASLLEQPKKLSSNYAIGRTSNASHVITRGNTNPADDVKIYKGQSWLSVSSPTEGSSHISVVATKAEGWDQRRQTATIYWIDAQWVFPAPAIVRAGQPVALNTVVSRTTNGSPHAGWIVRYEIPQGANAQFRNGQNVAEVPTDAAGNAAVEMIPRTNGPSTVQVSVQVIRPATASGDLPRTAVGQGVSTVTWSAAGLAVRVLGPDNVPLGSVTPFQIQIENTGDLPAPDIIVNAVIPPNFDFVSSDPAGQPLPGQVNWQLGDIAPRTTRAINVQLRGKGGGDARLTARAQSRTDNTLVAEGNKDRTRVSVPSLSVNISGPPTVEVGQQVRFQMQITNNTDALLTNVILKDSFDPGLAHLQGEASPIQVVLGNLSPRETQTKPVTFIATQPGQFCHTLEVTADGGIYQSARACVMVTPSTTPMASPRRNVTVSVRGPAQARLGQPITYSMTVVNNNSVPLNRVYIICNYRDHMTPLNASAGNIQRPGNQFVWYVEQMLPNGREERQIEFKVNQPLPAVCTLTVTADADVVVTDQANTQIFTDAGPTQANRERLDKPEINGSANSLSNSLSNDSDAKSTGSLTVDIADSVDPVRVGQWAKYSIVIKNERNISDRQVVLTIELPEGVDFQRDPPRVSGTTSIDRISADGRVIELRPITEMRAGDVIKPYELKIKALQAGKIIVRAKVHSLRTTSPVEDFEETKILPE